MTRTEPDTFDDDDLAIMRGDLWAAGVRRDHLVQRSAEDRLVADHDHTRTSGHVGPSVPSDDHIVTLSPDSSDRSVARAFGSRRSLGWFAAAAAAAVVVALIPVAIERTAPPPAGNTPATVASENPPPAIDQTTFPYTLSEVPQGFTGPDFQGGSGGQEMTYRSDRGSLMLSVISGSLPVEPDGSPAVSDETARAMMGTRGEVLEQIWWRDGSRHVGLSTTDPRIDDEQLRAIARGVRASSQQVVLPVSLTDPEWRVESIHPGSMAFTRGPDEFVWIYFGGEAIDLSQDLGATEITRESAAGRTIEVGVVTSTNGVPGWIVGSVDDRAPTFRLEARDTMTRDQLVAFVAGLQWRG